ncbi:MAG: DUF2156 domain-containing protein [Clostridia bacterium]|nr:DUF2156 domain-containing protein [Clostridia bacterium]
MNTYMQETVEALNFSAISLGDKALYEQYLRDGREHGCEYSFINLYLWGRQRAALLHDHIVLFSQFNRRSIYPYPIGRGDKKPVLDAIIADAARRGIACRISSLGEEEKEMLESLYPGKFRFHCDRDAFDYVYGIDDLADLKGKKYHGKRNHFYRFRDAHPNYTVVPLDENTLGSAMQMADAWYAEKLIENPDGDFQMEQAAIAKAFRHYRELGIEGLILMDGDEVLAITMGSRLSENTFDIHFEKARANVDGAYTAINCEFARYLREKYPELEFLNREDDMGIEGLRKAKLSYKPHHMIEKYWACLLEDDCDY